MIIMAMLLGTLWGVLNVYTSLFETAGAQATDAQLIVALERQLTDDLRSAIADGPGLEDASETPTADYSDHARRLGFVGAGNMLRFDVVQVLPEDRLPSAVELPSLGGASRSKPRVPELRTITYRFMPRRGDVTRSIRESTSEDDELLSATAVPIPGLSRWEIPIETPAEQIAAIRSPTERAVTEVDMEEASRGGKLGASFEDLLAQTVGSDAVTPMPEVRWAVFRYFDGQVWSAHWNSRECGYLPIAVEVTMRLAESENATVRRRPADASTRTPGESDETPTVEDQLTLGEDEGYPVEGRSAHRFLIWLPTARKQPENKPEQWLTTVP